MDPFPSGPYLAWQVRLSLPGYRDLTIAGPCNPALNRAFRHATGITLLPLTADGVNVDDERTTTISGDRDGAKGSWCASNAVSPG